MASPLSQAEPGPECSTPPANSRYPLMSTQRSNTITLIDPTLAAMTTDAVALTDVLTRTTNTHNPVAIQRISSILDRLNTAHRSLTQDA